MLKEHIQIMVEEIVYGILGFWVDCYKSGMIVDECILSDIIGNHFEQLDESEIDDFYRKIYDEEE
jgi:hypothetical protein